MSANGAISLLRFVRIAPVAAALLLPVMAQAQSLRVVPPDDWRYPLLDALILRRPAVARDVWLANRPWRAGEIAGVLARAGATPELSPLERQWVETLVSHKLGSDGVPIVYHNQVSGRYQGDFATDQASFEPPFAPPTFSEHRGAPDHRGVLQHDFAIQYGDRFVGGWRYVFDTNIRADPTRRTRIGIRGSERANVEVLDAYLTAVAGPVRATVGRFASSLGPGRATAVFLSDSIPALDQIRLELIADPIRFTALVSQLSRERPNRQLDPMGDTIEGSSPSEENPVPFDVTRFLYLHRLEWRVIDALQVALSEAAIVTGIDRNLEFRFANPFIPFSVTQEEKDEIDQENVNIVADVEAVFSLPRWRLYGDLFVEEFFIDSDKRRRIGNQLAWRGGAWWADPVGWQGGSVGLEFTRADVFTYLHRGLNTNWSTFGVPLGSSVGPDADQLYCWVDYWLSPGVILKADLLSRRMGERSIRTLESVIEAGNPPFPSGTVQRELRGGLELWGVEPEWGLEGRARVSWTHAENIENDPDRDGDFWQLALQLIYRLELDSR
jgi:hypothetical protein